MLPSVGRIVHYQLTESDAEAINRRRADFAASPPANTGFQAHVGNRAEEGQVLPAMVVRTFGGDAAINLQVQLDGTDTYWATSRSEGDRPGGWIWPPRV
jgi:hypothetical protein